MYDTHHGSVGNVAARAWYHSPKLAIKDFGEGNNGVVALEPLSQGELILGTLQRISSHKVTRACTQ